MKNIRKLILNLKCSGSDDKYEIGCILECMADRIEELEDKRVELKQASRENKMGFNRVDKVILNPFITYF